MQFTGVADSPGEVIKGCVRWYLTYRLSYRDLIALMAEWEVHISHTTIMRCVIRYVPQYKRRWNRRAKPVGSSWRVDETYIKTRPKTGHLYRVVDKQGKTVDSLFQISRGIAVAMAFFRKALAPGAPRWPRKITLDGYRPSHMGLRRLRREDHRPIRGRCRPMLGFKSYRTAAVTLAGIELAHRIRKRQFRLGPGRWNCWSLKKQWDTALA